MPEKQVLELLKTDISHGLSPEQVLEKRSQYGSNEINAARASGVTSLLGHILLALNLKQERLSVLKQGIFSYRFGALWLLGMFVFSIAVTNLPALYPLLETTSLPLPVWMIIIIIVITSTFWIDVKKRVLGLRFKA